MPYSVKGEGHAEPQIRERRVTEMGPALPIALHAANGGNRRSAADGGRRAVWAKMPHGRHSTTRSR